MMTEFNLLGGEESPRFNVTFTHRGKTRTLNVSEVTASDEDAVDRAFPYPPVPKKTDAEGRETLDLANVDWRRACNAIERERRFALIPLVAGLCGTNPGEVRIAHDKLVGRYRREQLEEIATKILAATELTEQDVAVEGEPLTPTGGTPDPSTPALPSNG